MSLLLNVYYILSNVLIVERRKKEKKIHFRKREEMELEQDQAFILVVAS